MVYFRSSSFPSISNPTTLRVESQLKKIQSSAVPSADEICNNLSSLEDLYKSVNALLKLNKTQQSDELLDGSVKILDICESIRDLVSQIKENVKDVQSALRRKSSSMESSIIKYTSFQKRTKKEAKILMSSLKQMEVKAASSTVFEVRAVAITIFQIVLLFVSAPVVSKAKQSKWSLFSMSSNKAAEIECESEIESRIEDIENGLDGVFRGMVKTRATLLNNISSSY